MSASTFPRANPPAWLAALLVLLHGACSGAYGPAIPDDGDGGKPDTGEGESAEVHNVALDVDGGLFQADDDPAAMMCGPDGQMLSMAADMAADTADVVGSLFCPTDKNLEGCPCPEDGKVAACWPGKRANRNQGICEDGMTTCMSTVEFGPLWGPCEGYVLPEEDATEGPESCRCFSNGRWKLRNVVPCIFDEGDGTYLLSSHENGDSGYKCDSVNTVPPPAPAESWTSSTLSVDCAGSFELCYTLKAGDADTPKDDDCVLSSTCVDVWYEQAGETQTLPALPGWASHDVACASQFVEEGGYGEMSVRGTTIECTPVDDGDGEPYVFNRVSYCRPDCDKTPDAEECRECAVGGAGDF